MLTVNIANSLARISTTTTATITKSKNDPYKGRMFGIILKPQTSRETDSLRGDIPRSRWVERALMMYNASMKEESQNGVRGSESSNQAPTAPTPSTEVITRKTNAFLNKGGLGA